MTPNDIDVLLHYHCSGKPHERLHAPAVQEAIQWFIEEDILCVNFQGQMRTTSRGRALVETLCNVEFPRRKWVDKDDRILCDAD